MIIKRLLIAAILLLGTVVVLFLYLPRQPVQQATPTAGAPAIGGPFTLVDTQGQPFSDANLKGRYSLIFFGFTNCPDICPLTLQNMSDAITAAGPAGEKVTPVFITVDPERDTVEAVASYVSAFHPRFVGLTGTPEQIREALSRYKVAAIKSPMKDSEGRLTGEYTVDHSAIIFLMDPDGRYVTHFQADTQAPQMAAYIQREVAK